MNKFVQMNKECFMIKHIKPTIVFTLIVAAHICCASDRQHFPIADFSKGKSGFSINEGREFPGAKGYFKLSTDASGKRVASLKADFSNGGAYIAIHKRMKLLFSIDKLSIRLKSSDVNRIGFRLVDGTGQTHQQTIKIVPNGEWQNIEITKFARGQAWGGAKDRKWHNLLKSIGVLLNKGGLKGKTGSIMIESINITGECKRNKLTVIPQKPANLFYDNEKIIIPLETAGNTIKWDVEDYWQRKIVSGQTKVNKNAPADQKVNAELEIPVKKRGYYFIKLKSYKNKKLIAEGYTTFGIIEKSNIATNTNNPFGVCTHFAQGWNLDVMPLIKKLGISAIRDEQYWGRLEKSKGKFVFPKKYTDYMDKAQKLGIKVLIPLTFANKLYDKGLTPYTDEGCDAYGRYAQAVLNKYGEQIEWLEPWNEYNGTWCEGPAKKDRSKYYTKLLKHSFKHIKDVRPDVQVIGCAPVLLPMMYMEGIFKNGGLKYLDKIVIHPYRGQPEGVGESLEEITQKVKEYNDGKSIPYWATETGFHNSGNYSWEQGHQGEKGRREVAKFNIRQNTLLLTRNVEKIFVYLARDFNQFKTMGLFRDTNSPLGRYSVNPSGISYAVMIRKLTGATYSKREKTDRFSYVQLFNKNGADLRICWATEPTHLVFKSDNTLKVTDMMGDEKILTPVNGEIYLTLTDTPMYVEGAIKSITKTGNFITSGRQTVDILGKMALKVQYNKKSLPVTSFIKSFASALNIYEEEKAQIIIKNVSTTLLEGSNIISVQNELTDTPREKTVYYELKVGEKLCGLGGIKISVEDPLSFSQNIRLDNKKRISLQLINSSSSSSYEIKRIKWSIGKKSSVANQLVELPASSLTKLFIPTNGINDFVSEQCKVEIEFSKRSKIKQSGKVSFVPISKVEISSPEKQERFKGLPKVNLVKTGLNRQRAGIKADGSFAWDKDNLYIKISVYDKKHIYDSLENLKRKPDSIQIAIAPSFSGHWHKLSKLNNWNEFTVTSAKQTAIIKGSNKLQEGPLRAKVDRKGSITNYSVTIPWQSISKEGEPLKEFNMSILINDSNGNSIKFVEWGEGITLGKTPEKFKSCFLQGIKPSINNSFEANTTSLKQNSENQVKITNSVDDYSKNQGKNNWYYGYYDLNTKDKGNRLFPTGVYTDESFKEMTHKQTIWGYSWRRPNDQFTNINVKTAHPGVFGGLPGWAVRRWESPISGTVRLKGYFENKSRQKKADGSGGRILVDGVEVFNCLVGGGKRPKEVQYPKRANFDITVKVNKGSRIDFCATPGEWTTLMYDGLGFNVDIFKHK